MTGTRFLILFAGLCGATGVLAGAWASHGGSALDAEAVRQVETGARYQLLHAVAVLGVVALSGTRPARSLTVAAFLFAAGILLFSGGLYVSALTGMRSVAMATPFGGMAFVAGWLAIAASALSSVGRDRAKS